MGNRKRSVTRHSEKREKLDKYRRDLDEAESKYDLNKAAELRHGKIPTLEKDIQEMENN